MKNKRFFIFVIFMFLSIFNFSNDSSILLANEKFTNISPTTFIHSAGRTSSLLLSNEGVVYGWGLWGEASNVTLSKKLTTPTDLSKDIDLKDDYFVNVFSGEQHSFMLTNNGKVFAFGSGEKRQFGYSDYLFKSKMTDISEIFSLNNQEKITFIACGDDFNIAISNQNRIFSFGLHEDGQLALTSNEKNEITNDITNKFDLQDGDYIVDVKCGADHALALSNNGHVYVWGSNKFGQLGIKDVLYLDTPTKITSIQESINKIAVGRYTSYVLTNHAQLYGFGSDSYGQLATHDVILSSNKKMTPYLMNAGFSLESDEYIVDIVAGYYYAFVKTNLSNYYSFGQNSSGQLGNGSTLSSSIPCKLEYKAMLESYDEIDLISCGQDHCLATTKYGRVLSWGSNLQGQLSEDENSIQAYYKIVDITYNFPPIIIISMNASSVLYQNYVLDVKAFYLDNEEINETYYSVSSSLEVPKDNWKQFKDTINISEGEGNFYIHIKVDSKKKTYYHVSKGYFLDHIAPTIQLLDKNNNKINSYYYNSTIFVNALDNNIDVEIVYLYEGEQFTTTSNTLTCLKDGKYQVYAKDVAGNYSATVEFQIDTILPTITKIENNLIQATSYETRENEITIHGSEAISCYKLSYKGVDADYYTALNDNESSFTIKLQKGVNTLTICDLAGNESLTYEIMYTPRFFQDTQLLLVVFGSLTAMFILAIIVVYTIRNKQKLLK